MIPASCVEMGTLERYEKTKEALMTSAGSSQISFEEGAIAVNMTTVKEEEVKPDKDPSMHK